MRRRPFGVDGVTGPAGIRHGGGEPAEAASGAATFTVGFRSTDGIRHSVEVTADSLFEAAALGLEAFRAAQLTAALPAVGGVLDVAVQAPTVTHQVWLQRLRERLDSAARPPKERTVKNRLKAILNGLD